MADNLQLLAHHEAGHAAIARHFGIRIHDVRIFPSTDSGAVRISSAEPVTPFQDAMIRLAGGRAEKQLDPEALTWRQSTLRDEVELANLIAARLDAKLPHRPIAYVDSLGDRVDHRLAGCCAGLVSLHWPAICRLAEALIIHSELDGNAAEDILGP